MTVLDTLVPELIVRDRPFGSAPERSVLIYIVTSVTILGSRQQRVTCSGCVQQYEYEAIRRGRGYSYHLPFIFQERADRKALERARKRLTIRLERAVDPVPCPYCGTLQPNMIRPKRRKEKTIWQSAV
jgi:hypothetical protein